MELDSLLPGTLRELSLKETEPLNAPVWVGLKLILRSHTAPSAREKLAVQSAGVPPVEICSQLGADGQLADIELCVSPFLDFNCLRAIAARVANSNCVKGKAVAGC